MIHVRKSPSGRRNCEFTTGGSGPQGWTWLRATALVVSAIPAAAGIAQERFDLEVPGQPELFSRAVVDAGSLTITGPDGELITYLREPAYDVPGYPAYLWSDGGQFIRFPESGTGPMYRSVDGLRWTTTRMFVTPAGPIAGIGVLPIAGAMHVDVLTDGSQSIIGRVDADGALEFWHDRGDGWRRIGRFPHDDLRPGAPLRMVDRTGAHFPTVFTVGRGGELLEVVDGAHLNLLSAPVPQQYVPGTHLAMGTHGPDQYLLAVRESGDFFRLRGDGTASWGSFGDVAPGIPLCVAGPASDAVFFVDRFGRLQGRWIGSWSDVTPALTTLPPDFQPGGVLAATTAVPPGSAMATTHLATVDSLGRILLVHDDGFGHWQVETVGSSRLTPGQPIALTSFAGELRIAFCTPLGELAELHGRAGVWNLSDVANGFPPLSPLRYIMIGHQLHCILVDRRGDIVIGRDVGGLWHFFVGQREIELAARLVDRRVIPNASAEPTPILWQNSFNEPLYVEVCDLRNANPPIRIDIPAGESVTAAVPRGAALTIEDTYELPVPGGLSQVEVRTYQVAAGPSHKVLVWKNPIVSVYRDRTGNPAERPPDVVRRGLISLGVFLLPPPGEAEGQVVHVYEEATRANNPGALDFRD